MVVINSVDLSSIRLSSITEYDSAYLYLTNYEKNTDQTKSFSSISIEKQKKWVIDKYDYYYESGISQNKRSLQSQISEK